MESQNLKLIKKNKEPCFSNKLTKHEKSIIAFVTLILLASCNNNTSKPTYTLREILKDQKRYFVYQRILDNKLVRLTLKMDGNSSLKAI
jgi:hypothetical protein